MALIENFFGRDEMIFQRWVEDGRFVDKNSFPIISELIEEAGEWIVL